MSAQKSLLEVDSFKKGLKKGKAIPKVEKENPKPIAKPLIKLEKPEIITEICTTEYDQIIPKLNIKNVELVDLLRGIAYEYKLNMVVDNSLNGKITLTLTNISVKDLIIFLKKEHNFKIEKINSILKYSKYIKIEKESVKKYTKKFNYY